MGVPYAEVIGDPIAHSKSPLIHKFWLEKLGLEGDYRAVRVPSGKLPDYFAARRDDPLWRGCNVTMPHKQKVSALLDETRTFATDAVNCIVREGNRLLGYNTDAAGVGAAVDRGVDTAFPVCIIGSGGAASAAIAALDILAVYQFNLIARKPGNARALLHPYGAYGKVYSFAEAEKALSSCSGLINASPLGMEGFAPMPGTVLASLSGLQRDAFVLDMVYSPPRTELLRRAEQHGLRAVDGLTMLLGQAREAFRLFFGPEVSRDDDAELRAVLSA